MRLDTSPRPASLSSTALARSAKSASASANATSFRSNSPANPGCARCSQALSVPLRPSHSDADTHPTHPPVA